MASPPRPARLGPGQCAAAVKSAGGVVGFSATACSQQAGSWHGLLPAHAGRLLSHAGTVSGCCVLHATAIGNHQCCLSSALPSAPVVASNKQQIHNNQHSVGTAISAMIISSVVGGQLHVQSRRSTVIQEKGTMSSNHVHCAGILLRSGRFLEHGPAQERRNRQVQGQLVCLAVSMVLLPSAAAPIHTVPTSTPPHLSSVTICWKAGRSPGSCAQQRCMSEM